MGPVVDRHQIEDPDELLWLVSRDYCTKFTIVSNQRPGLQTPETNQTTLAFFCPKKQKSKIPAKGKSFGCPGHQAASRLHTGMIGTTTRHAACIEAGS
jgi:hypothetical protein